MARRLTQKEFIELATLKHNGKYDYSLVEYVNSTTSVMIGCRTHGVFLQRPGLHIFGQGCKPCGIASRAKASTSTTEKFIQKAVLKHNGKYDYSLVEYVNNKTDVSIVCRSHGVFQQTPDVHLSGKGCSVCSGRKYNTDEFIRLARLVHGDTYDYSLSNYVTNKTGVVIVCKTHGRFLQSPNNHLRGMGCRSCSNEKFKSDVAKFIRKSKNKHGDKYDYSLVEYVNNKTDVEIFCKDHGSFLQSPNMHLRGHGCPDCNKSKMLTTDSFIDKAINIHGDRYDYSRVKYISSQTPILIVCKQHGAFPQRPSSHLSGRNCPVCSDTKLSTSEFIDRSRDVHGDTYDYSLSNYVNAKTDVVIVCKKHGSFLQNPSTHLKGSDCPDCAVTGYKTSKPGTLYYVRFDLPELTLWKIGITNRTVRERFLGFKVQPVVLWQQRWEDGTIAYEREYEIKYGGKYDQYKYTGDPLIESGYTECFTIDIMSLGNTTRVARSAA
jgi:hypothetical protein